MVLKTLALAWVAPLASLPPPHTPHSHHTALCAKSLSRVQLFVTTLSVAHQAPLSIGFSRQEYWGGLPCSPEDLPQPRDGFHISAETGSLPLAPPESKTGQLTRLPDPTHLEGLPPGMAFSHPLAYPSCVSDLTEAPCSQGSFLRMTCSERGAPPMLLLITLNSNCPFTADLPAMSGLTTISASVLGQCQSNKWINSLVSGQGRGPLSSKHKSPSGPPLGTASTWRQREQITAGRVRPSGWAWHQCRDRERVCVCVMKLFLEDKFQFTLKEEISLSRQSWGA